MKQLEDKILSINDYLRPYLGNCDLKGLVEEIISNGEQKRAEIGTEIAIQLNSDSNVTAYHIQNGEINFDKFQNRGKGKMYFPTVEMSMIFLAKNREIESKAINLFKGISDVTLKGSDSDKYKIWREETSSNETNFDYHIFKINYTYSFKTNECNIICK